MKWFLLLACCLVAAEAISFVQVAVEEWTLFKLQHGKAYSDTTEDKFRWKIFNENKHKIALHNQLYAKGQVKYSLGMNHYGDLLRSEVVNLLNGYKRSNTTRQAVGSTYLSPANVVVPDSVDWTKKGYVTPIKNQGQCGSCWAFSTTGALEGQHFKKTGKLVSLSEQQLVDCARAYDTSGCEGGEMDGAFKYIKATKGIDTEASYPYTGEDGTCHFEPSKVGATDTGFVDIPTGDETRLQEAVATVGPVSVAIDANHDSFQFYKTGVYDEPKCDSQNLDHGVLAVGYGTDKKYGDYWLVKNSWGTEWGDKGYIRMSRNKDNQCGIATSASYPLV